MSQTTYGELRGKDGLHGWVEGISTDPATAEERMLVRLDDGQSLLVPFDAVVLQEDGTYYLALSRSDLAARLGQATDTLATDTFATETVVVPVIAEEVAVEKRQVETGRLRVTKVVHEREEQIDQPLLRDEIRVERVPMHRVIDKPVSVRYEGETMVIPVMEEVLVIEKRLILKEEVHITKHQLETHEPQRVVLRSEDILIDRVETEEPTDR